MTRYKLRRDTAFGDHEIFSSEEIVLHLRRTPRGKNSWFSDMNSSSNGLYLVGGCVLESQEPEFLERCGYMERIENSLMDET